MKEEIRKIQNNIEFISKNSHKIDYGVLSKEQASQILQSLTLLSNNIKITYLIEQMTKGTTK